MSTLRWPFGLGMLLAVVLSLPALAQTDPLAWRTSLDNAKAEARQSGKFVLIHFWTEDCMPCMALERNVFNQPQVAAAIETRFVPVKLNANENPATAAGMGVTRVPTDIVITPDGEVVSKGISPATPMAYVGELSKVIANYADRSGQAFAAAAATAPMPPQLNAAYAGLQTGPTSMPALVQANSALAASRIAGSASRPGQMAPSYPMSYQTENAGSAMTPPFSAPFRPSDNARSLESDRGCCANERPAHIIYKRPIAFCSHLQITLVGRCTRLRRTAHLRAASHGRQPVRAGHCWYSVANPSDCPALRRCGDGRQRQSLCHGAASADHLFSRVRQRPGRGRRTVEHRVLSSERGPIHVWITVRTGCCGDHSYAAGHSQWNADRAHRHARSSAASAGCDAARL